MFQTDGISDRDSIPRASTSSEISHVQDGKKIHANSMPAPTATINWIEHETGANHATESQRLDDVIRVSDEQVIDARNFDWILEASSTNSKRSYSLAEIEDLALQNNAALGVALANIDKSSALRYQVGLRPNPTLGYSGQQMFDRGTDQHGIFVEQEFVRGNKLELNRRVLVFTQQAQTAEHEAQCYRVLTDVRIRFFQAIAAQKQLAAAEAFAEVAQQGVE
ncbi:MAG TPA: TolC family protein [Pirellulaceae bacterium]|nr:TolC family protein [Pirellulaceae bacterium]